MEFGLVVGWLLLCAALAAAGLPLAVRLFARVPGRGVGFALPVSLVVLTTVVYWLGHVSYAWPTLVVGLLVLFGGGVLAALDWDALRDGEYRRADLDIDTTAVAEVAVVFVVGFLLIVAIRAADPVLHALGGEKYLDFGLLRSLLRARKLPPQDMWFAGKPVRYYYGGQLIAATLTKLTGLVPFVSQVPAAYAYNLALAGFYGMLVAGAYELAGAVHAARGGSRRLAGVLGAFFVGFASNLLTISRLVTSSLPSPYRQQAATLLASQTTQLTVKDVLGGASSFWYWPASRVIPDTITEFPMFSYLNGDLHAHMLSTPFLLLAAGLAFSYYRTPANERRRRLILLFVALPLVATLQILINTWSFPTVFGIAWLALAFGPADPLTLIPGSFVERVRAYVGAEMGNGVRTDGSTVRARDWLGDELIRTASALVFVGVAGAIAVVMGLPFLLGAGAERSVEIVPAASRSGLGPLLLVHGAFLAAFAAYLFGALDPDRYVLLVLSVVAFVLIALQEHLAAIAIVAPILAAGWVAAHLREEIGFETVLVVAGAGLVLLVEFVYVKEQAGPGRLNTVFKAYMQVWVIWGAAMGAVVASLFSMDTLSKVGDTTRAVRGGSSIRRLTRTTVATVLVVALVVSTGMYGALALNNHFKYNHDSTLNSTAFLDQKYPATGAGVHWLDRNVEGQPTILAAPGTSITLTDGVRRVPGMYNWSANPASSFTGIPTVAGWGHEVGYRGTKPYYDRVRDVDRAFTGSTDQRVAVLRKYDVRYVWVGTAERARYGKNVSFADVPGVEQVFHSGDVTIYRVHQNKLPSIGVAGE